MNLWYTIWIATLYDYNSLAELRGVVKLFLDKGADVESKGQDGRTPLSWAAENGDGAVVQLLLKKGAGVEPKD
jgi:ankyrin repeat protein